MKIYEKILKYPLRSAILLQDHIWLSSSKNSAALQSSTTASTQPPSTSLYAKPFHLPQRHHNGYDHHGGKEAELNRRFDVSRCRRFFCRNRMQAGIGIAIVHAAAALDAQVLVHRLTASPPHRLVHLLATNSFDLLLLEIHSFSS